MTLDEIIGKVDTQTTVIASTTTLLNELAQLIRDNIGSPQKLQALADKIDASTAAAAAAVEANTDVDPTP